MRIEWQVLFWLTAGLMALTAILALQDVLLPFLAGMVIAYALNPVADRLARLGLPRVLASGIIVALLIVVLVALVVLVVPLLGHQLQQLVTSLPGELNRLREILEGWAAARLGAYFPDFKAGLDRGVAELSVNWASFAAAVAQSLWAKGRALVGFLALLLITPLVVFYLLIDWPRMLAKIDGWVPRDHEPTVRRLALEVDDAISAFIRGQGLVCLILGTVYAVGLSLTGLRYGLLIGLATGVLSFIPFVGWALGLITASTFAIIEHWPNATPLIIVVCVFAFGQVLDAAVLSPKIVGSRIGLHPVWLIFSLAVFSALFGIVGVLVAVPLAAAAAVLVRFALEVYMASDIYKGASRRIDPTP
ncbi:MAG: AI-2E family transporter [Hyphomicrobiaceae bacterium]